MEIVKVENKDCGGVGLTLRDNMGGLFKTVVFDLGDSIEIGLGYEVDGEVIDKKIALNIKKVSD